MTSGEQANAARVRIRMSFFIGLIKNPRISIVNPHADAREPDKLSAAREGRISVFCSLGFWWQGHRAAMSPPAEQRAE
jgi:hypothetical protein